METESVGGRRRRGVHALFMAVAHIRAPSHVSKGPLSTLRAGTPPPHPSPSHHTHSTGHTWKGKAAQNTRLNAKATEWCAQASTEEGVCGGRGREMEVE